MKNPNLLSFAAVFLIAALITGCAPQRRSQETPNQSSLLKAASGSYLSDDDSWRCPASANVRLKDYIGTNGYDYSGREDFTVCVSRDDVKRFKVIANQPAARAVCVYPMQTGYTGNLSLVEAPKCFTLDGDDFEVSFNSAAINYMTIVDVNYTQQMNSCLSSTASCPSHSEGFVQ